MRVTVNGNSLEVSEGTDLKGLIEGLGLSDRRVAVELNRKILPADAYAGTKLNEGDSLEIMSFVGGG